MTKEEVIEKAKVAASERFVDLDRFEVFAEFHSPYWVVTFEDPSELSDGADQHFAVQVDPTTGETTLFSGR